MDWAPLSPTTVAGTRFLGGGPGTIEYEHGGTGPDRLVRADPCIEVATHLVRAATREGGYLGCVATGTEPGDVFRVLMADCVLVYRIEGPGDDVDGIEGLHTIRMRWPD